MRKFAAGLILVALFFVLVGSRFKASDGDKLRSVSRLATTKIRSAMPPAVNVTAPMDLLRREIPTRPDDAVRARLTADKRFAGTEIKVTTEGDVVTLRGVVPSAEIKRLAVEIAETTVGVEKVADELAVPGE